MIWAFTGSLSSMLKGLSTSAVAQSVEIVCPSPAQLAHIRVVQKSFKSENKYQVTDG